MSSRIAINGTVLISGFIYAACIRNTMCRRHKLYISHIPFVSLVRLNEIWIRFICEYRRRPYYSVSLNMEIARKYTPLKSGIIVYVQQKKQLRNCSKIFLI